MRATPKRQARGSRWGVRNSRSFASTDSPKTTRPGSPHVQIMPRRYITDSPTPRHQAERESFLPAPLPPPPPYPAFSSQSFSNDDTSNYTSAPNFLSHQMGILENNAGNDETSQIPSGMPLEAFLKPNNGGRANRRRTQNQNSYEGFGSKKPINFSTRLSPAAEIFQPPMTPQRPVRTPTQQMEQDGYAKRNTMPSVIYLSPLRGSQPSHDDIMTMDYGSGGKLVCRFNDPFHKGPNGGQWCPIAYAHPSHVHNLEALELNCTKSAKNSNLNERAAIRARVAHGIQQMIDDGQLDPIHETDNAGLAAPITNRETAFQHTPHPVAQSRPLDGRGQHIPPTQSIFGPFTPPLNQVQNRDIVQYDPFVSPSYHRSSQRSFNAHAPLPQWSSQITAQDIHRWQESQINSNNIPQGSSELPRHNSIPHSGLMPPQPRPPQDEIALMGNPRYDHDREQYREQTRQRTVLHDPYHSQSIGGFPSPDARNYRNDSIVDWRYNTEVAQTEHHSNTYLAEQHVRQTLSPHVTHSSPYNSTDSMPASNNFQGSRHIDQFREATHGREQKIDQAIPQQAAPRGGNPARGSPRLRASAIHQDITDQEPRKTNGKEAHFPPLMPYHLESSESRFERLWSSGRQRFQEHMRLGYDRLQNSGGLRASNENEELAAAAVGPVLENVKFYYDEADKKIARRSKGLPLERSEPTPYDWNVYFARQYNPRKLPPFE